MRALVTLVALCVFGAALPVAAAPQAGRPPDVVVVVLDDMRASDWRALPQTTDLVGKQGTTFANFFATTPVCCPSRATLLTGRYAHNHGVLRNEGAGGGWDAFRAGGHEGSNLATWLDAAGYRTALVGKYLNRYDRVSAKPPPGWDRWYAVNTVGEDFAAFTLNENGKRVDYERYMTDVLRDKAVGVVRSAERDEPLFLYLALKPPHVPATPAKRHRGAFSDARVARSPSFNEADVGDKPAYMRDDRLTPRQEAALDRLERKRLRSLLAADEAIAAVVRALAAEGRLDNAYVFVLSDNGYLMGEHRRSSKGVPYEEAVRVPMLARGPGFSANATDRRLAATIDIAPTVAAIAGVAAPGADGRSLLDSWEREGVLIEGFGEGDDEPGGNKIGSPQPAPPYAAVRTAGRLYVAYATGERELYDLAADPHELDNLLAAAGADPPEVAGLAARLAELRDCAGDGCRAADGAE